MTPTPMPSVFQRCLNWGAVVAAAALLSGCFTLAAGGIAATALSVEDRRSTGMQVEDQAIEFRALAALGDKFRNQEAVHLNVTSYNRQLLVTGEVPDAATRMEVETILKGIENVRRVVSEVAVAPVSSLASRGSDAVVTTQVKSRFLGNNAFNPIHVKVVTEAGVVYLMGLVTRDEGEAAAEVARTTRGVMRVVKAFEYVIVTPRA
jgi:osmotically-inducible protein OsmY